MKSQLTYFCPRAPLFKYLQYYANTWCFGSLASELYDSGELFAEKDLTARIQEYLVRQSNGSSDFFLIISLWTRKETNASSVVIVSSNNGRK